MVEHKWIEAALKAFKKVMDKNSIPFWLEYGTQLGAVREHRIIPWDKDGDVGVFLADISLMKHCQKDFEAVGIMMAYQEGHAFVNYKINDREWIAVLDVYTFTVEKHNGKKWLARVENDKIFDIRSPYIYYKEFRTIVFLNERFNIPWKAEEALEFVYGKQWRTPIEIKPEAYKLKGPTPQELNEYGRTGRKKWKDV